MCGITGAVSNKLKQSVLKDRVAAMQTALLQRGPDDQGQVSLGTEKVAVSLAHTRLSIIDLSSDGQQPMSCANGRYTITYNGEIYNYRALRDELIEQGEHFQSQTDTEVILKLYQLHGDQCLEKLRGMFAFFIWDQDQQCGFAARDPLGIKPFYYSLNQDSLFFASECRALIKSGIASKQLSSSGLSSYFTRGSISEPNTVLNDIQLLPAGHQLHWRDGKAQLTQYSTITFESQNMSRSEALKITRRALKESVKAHLVGDVPVGIFLSGGIDSTALLALATQISPQQINTYSIAFEDPEWNEGDIAQRVAAHFGANHTQIVMTREMAQSLFDDFIQAIDQPTTDGFNTYCISKLAHEKGEKVVLSGLGGDELFAGYKSFELLPKMLRLSKITKPASGFFRLLSNRFGHFFSARVQRVLNFLVEPQSILAAHQCLRGIFSNQEARSLLTQLKLQLEPQHTTIDGMATHVLDKVSEVELSTYMRNQLLRDSDVMSMAWGLELRVPLVDHQLIEAITKIPAELRLQQGKRLLIDSIPEIPDWVVSRPKQGFRFPFDQWFSERWEQQTVSAELPSWISLKPWYRAWNLHVLKQWTKRHL